MRIGALTNSGGTFVAVSKVAIHPDYSATSSDFFNDIAILTLNSPVSGVTPMTINRNTESPDPSTTSAAVA